jgi:hypothetical protein
MKTKWLALSGASLAVLSSTALYINFLLFIVLGGKWLNNPYLSVYVFGINLGSVLNDVGLLLACGVLKTASCKALAEYFTTAAPSKVDPVPNFIPQSEGAHGNASMEIASQEGEYEHE